MAVLFRPTITPRERILVFGSAGTGKSHALLQIARKCKADNFYVIDNDYAYERLIYSDYPELVEAGDDEYTVKGFGTVHRLGNVHVFGVENDDWNSLLAAGSHIVDVMGKNDWMVVDMITATWDAVQQWFSNQVFGKDIEDYFLQVRQTRKSKKEGGSQTTLAPFEGFLDWSVINPQYKNKFQNLLLRVPGHLYATAEKAAVSTEDDKDTKALFEVLGCRPKGQKRTPHLFHTVILMEKKRRGDYLLSTAKDRGRDEMEDEAWTDFPREYLGAKAGWKMQKVE